MWWIIMGCVWKTQDTSLEQSIDDPPIEVIDDLSWVDPDNLPSGDNPCREPIRMRVNYVVDGDTFFADGDNGEEKVRIIGVNTPELHDDECYAAEAKTFLTQLISGKWVWLTFDRDCTDYYERTLAYVHVGTGEMDFVERQLLRGGYAQDFPFENTDTFAALFAMDEATARDDNVGGWGACNW